MSAISELYRRLLTIRIVEETLGALFAAGEVPGFLHLSLGQEAIAVGIGACLGPADTVASTHRGHGHALAKGIDLEAFFAELLGRSTGLCGGRGGSMHVADLSIGMLGANGIVAAGIPIALGSALAHRTLKRDAVSVAFFGDGARAEGVLHETLNMAAAWRVPLLLVCENNGWSEFTPGDLAFTASLEGLAKVFGLPYREVDGVDVEAVRDAAAELIGPMREGGGAAVLECRTHRFEGHFAGDPQRYRSDENLAAARAADPIECLVRRLSARPEAATLVADIRAEVTDTVARALERARAAQNPNGEELLALMPRELAHA